MQDFAETYREYSDDDLASLYGERDSLTEDARLALLSEVKRRGLSEESLSELRTEQIEYTKHIDEQWRDSRNADISRTARRFAIRMVLAIVGAILAALIALMKAK